MESSDTRYAQSGDVHLAYRLFGAGPFDLVFASGLDFPSVEFHAQSIGSGFDHLTQRMRVIRFLDANGPPVVIAPGSAVSVPAAFDRVLATDPADIVRSLGSQVTSRITVIARRPDGSPAVFAASP